MKVWEGNKKGWGNYDNEVLIHRSSNIQEGEKCVDGVNWDLIYCDNTFDIWNLKQQEVVWLSHWESVDGMNVY